MNYEIAVIGNDDAAFETLNLAAGSGRRTIAVVPSIRHSTWLVTQALRRLTSDLLVDRTISRRKIFARAARPRLLHSLLTRAIASELEEHLRMLEGIGVDVEIGEARLVRGSKRGDSLAVHCQTTAFAADHIVIATGERRTAMPPVAGGRRYHKPETLLSGRKLPDSLRVVGGGDLGAGLATLASLFGVDTRLTSPNDRDSVMLELATSAGVKFEPWWTECQTESSAAEKLVDCRRIVGCTDHLNLDAVDIEPDENGQLWCADSMETWCPRIFGAGSVVGFSPASALPVTAQAERILSRISHRVPRPHLLSQRASVSA